MLAMKPNPSKSRKKLQRRKKFPRLSRYFLNLLFESVVHILGYGFHSVPVVSSDRFFCPRRLLHLEAEPEQKQEEAPKTEEVPTPEPISGKVEEITEDVVQIGACCTCVEPNTQPRTSVGIPSWTAIGCAEATRSPNTKPIFFPFTFGVVTATAPKQPVVPEVKPEPKQEPVAVPEEERRAIQESWGNFSPATPIGERQFESVPTGSAEELAAKLRQQNNVPIQPVSLAKEEEPEQEQVTIPALRILFKTSLMLAI